MGTLSRLGPSYYTCTTDVARSTMGLVWIKKIWAETSTSRRLYHYYYFKTIGYSSRTKVKSSLILRRFYATWPWPLTLGLKCYYLWELYHAWVLVITFVLSTDVARSTMGLVWIKKIWAETSTSRRLYHYYYFKTIGYSSRTKVKSSLILRRFYATWPWPLTLGLKCYYLWELYHAWVLVITFVLSTDVARSTMGLVWIKKIWAET